MIKVTVWNEFLHERTDENVKKIYPNGIHNTIASFLKCDDVVVRTATLSDPECGLTKEIIEDTDVLIWWGHMKHHEVSDEIAIRVQNAVLEGMGIIFLHSSHHSKPFKLLMGTSCNLNWREDADKELLWKCNISHPIFKGIDRYIMIPNEEVYAEPFDIPEPDELLAISSYEGGEVFRSACTFKRGNGKIFYFQPGHETYPTYYIPEIQEVIKNAVIWAYSDTRISLKCPNIKKINVYNK